MTGAARGPAVHPFRWLTGRGVRVAVIDSGWDRSIDDRRVVPGVALVEGAGAALELSSDDRDRIGHGTICADLVLQVAPAAEVVPVRIFGDRLETSPHVLAAAIHWAAEHGAHIINLSLGTTRDDAVPLLYAACAAATARGVVLVAAAGGAAASRSYPALFEPVIGVGVTRLRTRFAFRYLIGDGIECRAVGRHVARSLGGIRRDVTGTSAATAVLSGHVARIRELAPTADLEVVRQLLESHAAS